VSRNGNDWTDRLAHLSAAALELGAERAVLDGELVHIDEQGRTSFARVANAIGSGGARELLFHAFDILHLDGHDLTREPLLERKRVLERLTRDKTPSIRYTDHVLGRGGDFLREACKLELEGIVSKRSDAPYRPGRGRDWLKIKCLQRQEFVIVGWTPPTHAGDRLGSLVLGVHGDDGLVYAGRVGTGFGRSDRAKLRDALDELAVERSALAHRPRAPGLRDVQWVEPRLVAEVAFTEWTSDGRLRHPTFRGLREDKRASAVVRERAEPTSRAKAANDKGSKSDARVGGLVISNPDKVLFPDAGVTKLELARYYESIANAILPHLRDRPVMLRRCPEGSSKPCFYQKHAGTGLPPSIATFEVEEDDGETGIYLAVVDLEGLIGAVQLGALELHVWGSRRDRVERPDRMVIDLDPDPSVPFADVKIAALEVRERLSALELESFVMLTGGKGLHVVVPLARAHDFEEVKAFSRALAERMVADAPRRFVAQATKSKRVGRIFVDYLRNGRGATAICPYSTRARPNASVAVPIGWKELDGIERGDEYDIAAVRARLARRRTHAWAGYDELHQRLTAAARRAVKAAVEG
jgi:bifunctional non-homologous end joining protein LigD